MKPAEHWLSKLPPDVLEHPMPLPVRMDYALKVIRQIQADAQDGFLDELRKVVEQPYRAKHGKALTWEAGWAWEALAFIKQELS